MFNRSKTERFRQMAEDVISNSRDWARTSQDLAEKGSHRAKRFIYGKPMAATFLALGVGYLLGRIFTRSKPVVVPVAPAKRGRSSRS